MLSWSCLRLGAFVEINLTWWGYESPVGSLKQSEEEDGKIVVLFCSLQ